MQAAYWRGLATSLDLKISGLQEWMTIIYYPADSSLSGLIILKERVLRSFCSTLEDGADCCCFMIG